MNGQSLICTCGDAIHIDESGRRRSCYDGQPHLDHSAYQDWAQRHGYTDASLGWLPEVLTFPHSIRIHLVSDRLLWRCGLLPGIDFSQYPPWSGRGTTTAGQPLSGFSAEHPWDHLPPEDEKQAPEAPEMPETATKGRSEGDGTDPLGSGPSVKRRFGADIKSTTPGKSAAKRWGQ